MFLKNLAFLALFVVVAVKSDCSEVTLDDCDYGDLAPFETSNNLDREICQFFCNDIYTDKCTFFIYDQRDKKCELFDYEATQYTDTCKIIGGTPDINDLEECKTPSEPCDVSSKED